MPAKCGGQASDGGRLQRLARARARRLGRPRQVDARAEDQDDYCNRFLERGLAARERALRDQKSEEHAIRSAVLAMTRLSYNQLRDAARAQARAEFLPVDVDLVSRDPEIERRVDCVHAVRMLCRCMPAKCCWWWGHLADHDGRISEAARAAGVSRARAQRLTAELRMTARKMLGRAVKDSGIGVIPW